MQVVKIFSGSDDKHIILKGDINQIVNSRRAFRYLKDFFMFEKGEGYLLIQTEDVSKSIERLEKICHYAHLELEFSSEISQEMAEYKLEEEKFLEFSAQAKSIRDNEVNKQEFKTFVDSVGSNLTNRVLYPLQLLSAYHLAFSQNACNFSVPGAGKTSVVYGAFAYLSNLDSSDKKHVDRLLIISPLSAFGPWELEFEECFGFKPQTIRLSGKTSLEDKQNYLHSFDPAQLTLLSYASVISLKEDIISFLKNNRVMVVLDEAHKIKNTNGGIISSSVLELASHCAARVVLTGTPAPNGYEDLYNLYKFIWPTKQVIPFDIAQLKDMSKSNEDPRLPTLLNAVEPFFIRVRKSDLGIPKAIEHPSICIQMGEVQKRIYEVIEKKYMTEIISCESMKFQQDLCKARMMRLMQVATNPHLLKIPLQKFQGFEGLDSSSIREDSQFMNDILNYSEIEMPPKFIKAKEIIEEILKTRGKVVVWAIYIRTILDFESYLKQNGIDCRTLYGATPIASNDEDEEVETREKIIREFHNENSTFKVIIANPFAVSESISLHKACHNAIYIERSFNAAHFLQSKDRIHRYGLKPGVETNYYYLISKNTIDSVIDSRLKVKEQRLKDIIENMPIPLFSNVGLETGDDDIKAMIADYVNRSKKI